MSFTTQGSRYKSENGVENHISTYDDRSCIDALLDCSERFEDYIDTINCDDWSEVAVGWKATIPNVKFVAHVPPTKRRKDDDDDKASKHRSPYEGGVPWSRKGETTTYRYTNRNKTHTSVKSSSESSVSKKQDPAIHEHINRVREHLEIALKNREHGQLDFHTKSQLNEAFVTDFLKNLQDQLEGDSTGKLITTVNPKQVVNNVRATTRYRVTDCIVEKIEEQKDSSGNSNYVSSIPDVKRKGDKGSDGSKGNTDVELVVENSRIQAIQQLCSKHETVMKKDKELDLLDKINKKLDESLAEHDQYTVKLKKKHPSGADKLTSKSYEKFPAFTIRPVDQDLRPLRKLTPSQRKASDDGEMLSKMRSESENDVRGHVSSAPSLPVSGSCSSMSFTPSESDKCGSDSPNKNFMTRGINGKSISTKLTNGLKQSPYAQQVNIKDSKKKVSVRPRKLASICSPNSSDGLTPRHIGQAVNARPERDTGPTIAADLLPVIDGKKMTVPLMTQRLL